eukprot:TRINITY_DN61830_c0_g1_i1.p1 TRINITY_DN61830_c0_g1~~TRINITY_DN61830_c0_g1_i1.p1  ORF type:complete len:404 (-),score=64.75 TRINITY_DN61830_c0_g1_i1:207-1304(-)
MQIARQNTEQLSIGSGAEVFERMCSFSSSCVQGGQPRAMTEPPGAEVGEDVLQWTTRAAELGEDVLQVGRRSGKASETRVTWALELDEQEEDEQPSPVAAALQILEDEMSGILDENILAGVLTNAVSACSFAVSIADPRTEGISIVAVSKGFEKLTGYSCYEAKGRNFRFLNTGCPLKDSQRTGLRMASMTGRPFSAVLDNRKKNGELFLNFVDLRGLTLATNSTTGEELWFLIGIHADVTDLLETETTQNDMAEAFRSVRQRIGSRLKAIISEANSGFELGSSSSKWSLNVKWKPRKSHDLYASLSVDEFSHERCEESVAPVHSAALKHEDAHSLTSSLFGGIMLASATVLISGLLWRRTCSAR